MLRGSMRFRISLPIRALVAILILGTCCLPRTVGAGAASILLQGFPKLRQQHSLTCESSAASMATRGRITESQLMAVMPHNPNPNLGFRGSIDGEEGTTLVDYGVYAAPLHAALLHFGYPNDVVMYGNRWSIVSSLSKGWPLVAWVTYNLQPGKPRLAQTNMIPFVLVPHEHAVLILGYDDAGVYANDPWTAKLVHYGWHSFNHSWGLFGNMALSIQPCQNPDPVAHLRVAGGGTRWTWKASRNADHYHVTLIREGLHNRVVFQGDQSGHAYVFPDPIGGATYRLVVQAISVCGGASAKNQLSYQAPIAAATPTPVEGTVVPTIPTASPQPTASPPPAASPTVTPSPSIAPHPTVSPTPGH